MSAMPKHVECFHLMEGMELLFVKGYRPFQAGKLRCFEREEFAGRFDPA